MLTGLRGVTEDELVAAVSEYSREGRAVLGSGYQGSVYLYEDSEPAVVIKEPRGLVAALARRMLRKEAAIYARIGELEGVPRCFGLAAGRYLVIERIEAVPFREARFADREHYFRRLRALVGELHARGVAHGDLKKKDNLLVIDGREPCILDYGVAVLRKEGFAPLNHFLWGLAARFDINAVTKHRLGYTPFGEDFDDPALEYHRTVVETLAGSIKRAWCRLRGKPIRPRGKRVISRD